jgi:hypothetical protein
MSIAAEASDLSFPHRHLLGIEGLSPAEFKRRHREGLFAAPGEHRDP